MQLMHEPDDCTAQHTAELTRTNMHAALNTAAHPLIQRLHCVAVVAQLL
jgi:hypothetical protein